MNKESGQRRGQEWIALFRITLIAVCGILITGTVGLLISRRQKDQNIRRQELVKELYARISEDPHETFRVDPDAYPVEGEDEEMTSDSKEEASAFRSDPVISSDLFSDHAEKTDGSVSNAAEGNINLRDTTVPVIDQERMGEDPVDRSDFHGQEDLIDASQAGEYVLTSLGTIQIPSISCSLPVWEGAGKIEMRYGAGHMPYSVLPGMQGNCVIYGHRMRAYGSMFNRLGEVKKGDVIRLSSEESSYAYIVDQIEVISPSLLSDYINAEDEIPRVTLITCTPTGVATHRLIVIGHLQG